MENKGFSIWEVSGDSPNQTVSRFIELRDKFISGEVDVANTKELIDLLNTEWKTAYYKGSVHDLFEKAVEFMVEAAGIRPGCRGFTWRGDVLDVWFSFSYVSGVGLKDDIIRGSFSLGDFHQVATFIRDHQRYARWNPKLGRCVD